MGSLRTVLGKMVGLAKSGKLTGQMLTVFIKETADPAVGAPVFCGKMLAEPSAFEHEAKSMFVFSPRLQTLRSGREKRRAS